MAAWYVFIRVLPLLASVMVPLHSFAMEGFWTRFTTGNSGLESNSVSIVTVDENNVKWIVYADTPGKITRYDGYAWKTYSAADGLPDGKVTSIAAVKGAVWAIADSRLCRLRDERWEIFFPYQPRYFYTGKAAADPSENLWVSGKLSEKDQNTISRFDGVSWVTWPIAGPVGALSFDRDGGLWASRFGECLLHFDGVRWRRFTHERLRWVLSVATDAGGTVWVAGETGAASFDGAGWDFTCSCSIAGKSVASDAFGRVWFAGADAIIVYDPRTQSIEYVDSIQKIDRIAPEKDGSMLFHHSGEASGLFRYSQTPASPSGSTRSLSFNGNMGKMSAFPVQPVSPRRTMNDPEWFPLGEDNKWIYRRKLRPQLGWDKPVFEDHVVLTAVGKSAYGDTLYTEFLDGRLYRMNGASIIQRNGKTQREEVIYDFTSCDGANCTNGVYRYAAPSFYGFAARSASSVETPAGRFESLLFSFGDIHGENMHLASGVGIVSWKQVSDNGMMDDLELEYARVNGRDYGVKSSVKNASAPMPLTVYPPLPNPFNSSTAIRFELAEPTIVRLSIYSMTGQKVTELCNAAFSPGLHAIDWKPGDCAAGLYFFLLETGTSRRAGKMTYLK